MFFTVSESKFDQKRDVLPVVQAMVANIDSLLRKGETGVAYIKRKDAEFTSIKTQLNNLKTIDTVSLAIILGLEQQLTQAENELYERLTDYAGSLKIKY